MNYYNKGVFHVDVRVRGTKKQCFGLILSAFTHRFDFKAKGVQDLLDRVDILMKRHELTCTELEHAYDQSVVYITLKNDDTTMRFTAVEIMNDYKVNCGGILYSSELKIF